MKTKKIKPFSIEEWKNGAKIETRDGRPVRIICTDFKSSNPIIAAVMKEDGGESSFFYHADGLYYKNFEWDCDLVIVEEIEEVENTEEHEQYNGDVCGDNRFEIIDAAKKHLLDATNINTSPEEMAVLDSFLFRCWQMGWLKDFDTKRVEDTQSTSDEEPKRWAEDDFAVGDGWTTYDDDCLANITRREGFRLNNKENYDLFATERQAKSAIAMARISQLMAHDERYGGVVTDEEWKNTISLKYVIKRVNVCIDCPEYSSSFHFLAFHTAEQRDLFLAENEQLVKDYLMID